MRRVVVVGTSGSGKTTFARQISERLGVPHLELDALYWQNPDWQPPEPEDFRSQLRGIIPDGGWVMDGNYSLARDITWPLADTLVWLDYPLPVIVWRLFWRTLDRSLTRKDLWGSGNRESLRIQFLTRESLFLWVFQTYPRYRQEYPILLQQPEYAHLDVARLRSPRAAQSWLKSIAAPSGTT